MNGSDSASAAGAAPRRGLLIVHVGDGREKTVAALAAVFRTWGRGRRVLVLQFGRAHPCYDEVATAKRLGLDLVIRPVGQDLAWRTADRERDARVAELVWAVCRDEILSGRYDLVILDEINHVIQRGYLDLEEVIATVRERPEQLHILLTGRGAPEGLQAVADRVTGRAQVGIVLRTVRVQAAAAG